MNQENNNQPKTTNPFGPNQSTDGEKDFLAREEVKTMGKDISRLREVEANREREKVAKIKTGEEIIREKERERLAQEASLERELAEKEAQKTEERISSMREISEEPVREEKKTAEKAEDFKSVLKETQTQEEESRRRFLERVAKRAEAKEEDTVLTPVQAAPIIGEEKIPEITKTFFKKPSSSQKLWIRIILSLLALSILALVATFAYWYFAVRKTPPPSEKPGATTPVNELPEKKELVIPPLPFYIENSQTLKISQASEVPFLLFQALKGKTALDSVNRILLEDTVNVKILGLKELFDSFNITPPDNFYEKLSNDATLFVYSQEEGNRLGLTVKISTKEGLAGIMASWEGNMEENFKSFFELLGKTEPALSSSFKDAKYQEASFRFQTFNRQDLGIVYAIFDNYFILTTSWKSMEKTLDKLKEAPLSLEKMNLAKKIGQLFFIGINGTTLTKETEKLIADIQPGGILLLKKNIINEEQTRNLILGLQQTALKDYGIPLFIGVDQEGGEISPVNFAREKTGQSEIKTAAQAYTVGFGRGEELRALGINLNLAPVLDIVQPGDFVFNRAFQATDSETRAFAKALIFGQKTADILTAIKHFPGYGDIAFDPEDKLATLKEAPQVSLFATAAQSKPEFVMTSNVIYATIDPDLPFSFSAKGIKLLKENLGQDPLIMTDDLPQQSLIDKFSLKGVVTLPVKAGADMLTFSTNWETTLQASVGILKEAVQSGEISQEQIDGSVFKIIKLKKVYYHYE